MAMEELEVRRFGSLRYLLRRPRGLGGGPGGPGPSGPGGPATDLVLLLPGAAGRAEHWMPQLQANVWGPGHHIVAVDYPGSGDAGSVAAQGGPCCSTDAEAALMWALVASLGLPAAARVHLAGLSFGGMVAQKMAAQRPKDVASLVLLNTYPGWASGARPWPFFLRGLVWLTLCALTLCRLDKASSDLNEAWLLWGAPAWRAPAAAAYGRAVRILAEASVRRPPPSASAAMREWLQRRVGDFSFVLAVLRHSLSRPEAARLRSLERRVVAVGARDWLVRPANGRRLAELLSCPLVVFPACGHFVQLEAPEELSSRLAQWCTGPLEHGKTAR